MLGARQSWQGTANLVGAGAISVGTVGAATYDTTNFTSPGGGSYSFAAPTVDGGGAAILLVACWHVAFGDRNADMGAGPGAFTLNGAGPDALLYGYGYNIGSNRYTQSAAGLWFAPTAGAAIITPGKTTTAAGMFFMNLAGVDTGLPLASPVVRDVGVAAATAMPNTIDTEVANSLVVGVAAARNAGAGAFTWDDGTFDTNEIAERVGSGDTNGPFAVSYRNELALGTYDVGGDWASSATDRATSVAFELRPA